MKETKIILEKHANGILDKSNNQEKFNTNSRYDVCWEYMSWILKRNNIVNHHCVLLRPQKHN